MSTRWFRLALLLMAAVPVGARGEDAADAEDAEDAKDAGASGETQEPAAPGEKPALVEFSDLELRTP